MGSYHDSSRYKEERKNIHQQVDELVMNFLMYKVMPYHQPTDVDTYVGYNHGTDSVRMNQIHDEQL